MTSPDSPSERNPGKRLKLFLGLSLVLATTMALGGRAIYPPDLSAGADPPHELIEKFDQILLVMMQIHIPELLGAVAPAVISLLFVAILAASMSTADSNLHALSAVATRDIYDRFIRPKSSEKERAWVGRIVIVAATFLALGLVYFGKANPDFRPLQLIAEMMLYAVAFSSQLVPVTFDVLFVNRGTRAGAIAGLSAGLLTVITMLVFTKVVAEPVDFLSQIGKILDNSFIGITVNIIVFAAVSCLTRKLPAAHVEAFKDDLTDD